MTEQLVTLDCTFCPGPFRYTDFLRVNPPSTSFLSYRTVRRKTTISCLRSLERAVLLFGRWKSLCSYRDTKIEVRRGDGTSLEIKKSYSDCSGVVVSRHCLRLTPYKTVTGPYGFKQLQKVFNVVCPFNYCLSMVDR